VIWDGPWKIFGQFDGPPIILYVHGWATKQKPISTFITYYYKYNSKYNIIQIKHNTNLTGQGCTLHRGQQGQLPPAEKI
jgi:hypothetical protein